MYQKYHQPTKRKGQPGRIPTSPKWKKMELCLETPDPFSQRLFDGVLCPGWHKESGLRYPFAEQNSPKEFRSDVSPLVRRNIDN
jgi:hypothetical protein